MEYFFVKSNDNDTVHEISIDNVNYLALFATTLEPLSEVTIYDGYAAALDEYYSQNTDDYSKCYHDLVSSSEGKTFLCTSIQLMYLEKRFKKSGIDENGLQAYERCLQDYKHQIEFNQSMFEGYISSNKK